MTIFIITQKMLLKFSGIGLLNKSNELKLMENLSSKKPPVTTPAAASMGSFYAKPDPVDGFHQQLFQHAVGNFKRTGIKTLN